MSHDNEGSGDFPEGLKKLLGLPEGAKIEGVTVLGGPSGGRSRQLRPATLANLQGLLEGTNQPKFEIGDIVVLRPWARNNFKFPKDGDRCIVTQVLDVPHRSGEAGTQRPAVPENIALAFVAQDGDVVEFLHDSRMFQKVGSIYDPVTMPDGEQLPVQ